MHKYLFDYAVVKEPQSLYILKHLALQPDTLSLFTLNAAYTLKNSPIDLTLPFHRFYDLFLYDGRDVWCYLFAYRDPFYYKLL